MIMRASTTCSMSSIAVQQSNNLMSMIDDRMNTTSEDTWHFYWNNTKYSNKRIYLEYIGNPPDAPKPFQWIWKSCTMPNRSSFLASTAGHIEYRRSSVEEELQHWDWQMCIMQWWTKWEPHTSIFQLWFQSELLVDYWIPIEHCLWSHRNVNGWKEKK